MDGWGQNNGWGMLGQLANGLQNTVSSPLFQAGAAMFNAGAEGKNVGAGVGAAGQAAASANANALALAKAQREMDIMHQQDQYWRTFNPQDPQWKGLPPGLLNLAAANRDSNIIAKAYTSKLDLEQQSRMKAMELDMAYRQAAKLGDMKMANENKLKQQEQELELQMLQRRFEMLGKLRQNQAGGAPPLRYNPNTDVLE